MAEGIEFTIEILDKIDAAVRASKELDEVTKAARRADDATRKYEKSAGTLGKTLSAVGGVIKGFVGHLAALAVWDGIKEGAHALTEVGKSAFEAAAGAERMEKSFAFMFGKERGQALLERGDKTAKVSQFSDDVQKMARQRLLAAGFADKQLGFVVAAAGDIAAKTATGEAGFWDAISKFQMMQTTGKAPMRLNEMGLGAGAGKAIEKEMHQGMTAVDAFLTVLQRSNGGKPLGALDEEMSKLADVRAKKLLDLPGQYFQQLSGTAAYQKFSDQLGKLLEAFDPDSERGKKIFSGIETLVTKVADMIAKIDVDKWSTVLINTFEKLPRWIEMATDALVAFGRTFGLIQWEKIPGAGGAASAHAGVPATQMLTGKAPTTVQDMFVGTVKEEPELAAWHDRIANAKGFWPTVKAIFGSGKDAAAGMAAGVKAGEPQAVGAVEKMGDGAVGALRGTLQEHSPSKVFARSGMNAALGFALGLREAMPSVDDEIQRFSPEVLTPDLISPPRAAAAPALIAAAGTGGRGGISVEAHITVNVAAGAPADAREVGEAAADGARQALQSLLEQLQAEGA